MRRPELGRKLTLVYTAAALAIAGCATPPPPGNLTAKDRLQTQIALASGTDTPPSNNTALALPNVNIPPEVATQAAYVPTRIAQMRQDLSQISFPNGTPVPPTEATPSGSTSARDRLATQVAISQGTVSPAATPEAQTTPAPASEPILNQCRMLRPIDPSWLNGKRPIILDYWPANVHNALSQTATVLQSQLIDNSFAPAHGFTEQDFLRIRQNLINYRFTFNGAAGTIQGGGSGYIISGNNETLTLITHGHTNMPGADGVYPSDPGKYSPFYLRDQINQREYSSKVVSAQVFPDPNEVQIGSITVITITNPDPQRFADASACAFPLRANYKPNLGDWSLITGFSGSFNYHPQSGEITPYSIIQAEYGQAREPHPICPDNMYNIYTAQTVSGASGSSNFVKTAAGEIFIADILQTGIIPEWSGQNLHFTCLRRIPAEIASS